jgi:hypothetical protein
VSARHRATVSINVAAWRRTVVSHRRRPSVNAPFVAMLVVLGVWAAVILFLLLQSW